MNACPFKAVSELSFFQPVKLTDNLLDACTGQGVCENSACGQEGCIKGPAAEAAFIGCALFSSLKAAAPSDLHTESVPRRDLTPTLKPMPITLSHNQSPERSD
jgi:hypothetical protein